MGYLVTQLLEDCREPKDSYDLLKIVGPTIVEPWRKLIEGADTIMRLLELRKRLTDLVVLDPACGSGNFLYIAYREMKRLEKKIFDRINELSTRKDEQRLIGFVTANQRSTAPRSSNRISARITSTPCARLIRRCRAWPTTASFGSASHTIICRSVRPPIRSPAERAWSARKTPQQQVCNVTPQHVYQGQVPGHKSFVLSREDAANFPKSDNCNQKIIHPFLIGRDHQA